MTDLRTLADAFAELERRADAATGTLPPTAPAPRLASRLAPVAAAVAVLAGVVAGVTLFAPGSDSGVRTAAPPGDQSSAGVPPTGAPTTLAQTAPDTPEKLIERFRAALGELATFTVTDSGPGAAIVTLPTPGGAPAATTPPPLTVGASIRGTLTAAGVTGGFDLVATPGSPGAQREWGEGYTVRTLPDGTQVVTGEFPLEGPPGGVDRDVQVYRPGLELSLHVSNQRSPKGQSELLGPHPPLTIDQMVAILTDRW